MAVRITAIIYDTYKPALLSASKDSDTIVDVFTKHDYDTDPSATARTLESFDKADLILLHRNGHLFWDALDPRILELRDSKKIVSLGLDPIDYSYGNVGPQVTQSVQTYLSNRGDENIVRLLKYLKREVTGEDIEIEPPVDLPWDGIIHPDHEGVFDTLDEYLAHYPIIKKKPSIGILMSRSAYLTGRAGMEYSLFRALEKRGLNVILVFSMSTHDEARGSRSLSESLMHYMSGKDGLIVDGVVKTSMFRFSPYRGKTATEFLQSLDIPVFNPVMANNTSRERFDNTAGIDADVPRLVGVPEMEGVIEPVLLGFSRDHEDDDSTRIWSDERVGKLADRIASRLALRYKPNCEKKVVLLLNNSPCANADANIGSATYLDTHETVRDIMAAMKDAGYTVNVPSSGKALIDDIVTHRAMSEFRWTSVEDIAASGGVLEYMHIDAYRDYFDTLPEKVRREMVATWGEPPGEGMVLDGHILITGIRYGNVIVALQPKRGCYGPKCDGSVCRILHDPRCPPTHQYLATYHYFEDIWGADAIVHVGTHGSLEYLPGKTVGMTSECYPDIAIGRTPHIYVFNSGSPSQGSAAKRRSYATLIDHMQSVMKPAGLHSELDELDSALEGYLDAKSDPAQEEICRQIVSEKAIKTGIQSLAHANEMNGNLLVRACNEELSRIRNAYVNVGFHIFGRMPEGMDRAYLVESALRFESDTNSPRCIVAEALGYDLESLYKNQYKTGTPGRLSDGRIIETITRKSIDLVYSILNGSEPSGVIPELAHFDHTRMECMISLIRTISKDIDASDEMDSLLHALGGGYTAPGPSGDVSHGRYDVLPTGRNFYTIDPTRLPSPAAWEVGKILSEDTIRKYIDDFGNYPENIAFFWMSNDIQSSGGEVMAQIMHLIGVEPVRNPNGQVKEFAIIPLERLGRPRIDVTIRASSLIRDGFPGCIDMIDSAIRKLAELDEPPESNFIRKHTETSRRNGVDTEAATARVFSAPPGSYSSGIMLAVYASAWKTEKDLAEIYISGNGYAYGNGRNGKPAHNQFANALSTVTATYNKVSSDEHDILGTCGCFSNQGGLTTASSFLSGKKVKAYFGDTRNPRDIGIRTLSEEIDRITQTKIFNPVWIEGMKNHGYRGCTEMMKRIQRIYGFEASTGQVDDSVFDTIAETFTNNPEMRGFFQENNPFALEEISRRLLEAHQRGLWKTSKDTIECLKRNYIECESWLEENESDGDHQGGSVDIVTCDDVPEWRSAIDETISGFGECVKRHRYYRTQHYRDLILVDVWGYCTR